MGLLLDSINTGVNIARAQQSKREQEEARKQRQAEALALQNWRNDQQINYARDDERAMKQAETLEEWRTAENQRRAQADQDRDEDRKRIAEDRGVATKDRSAAAAEKLAEQLSQQQFQDAYQQAIAAPKTLEEMQSLYPEGEMTQIGELPKQRTALEAVDFVSGQPGIKVPMDVLEKRMTAQAQAERLARSGREIPDEPQVMHKNGRDYYLGANEWHLIPGIGDKPNFYHETVKLPGSNTTIRRTVPNAKPEAPATPEQTAALAEFYARRSAAVPHPQPPPQPPAQSRNYNRQGNAPVVRAQQPKPAAKPKDDEKVEMISPKGKRGMVPKSQRDQALKQGYTLPP